MRHLFFVLISLMFMGCFEPAPPANNGNTGNTTTTTTNTTNTTNQTPTENTNTTTAPTTKTDTKATEKKSGSVGKWIHSKEEDTDRHEVFRADGYNFPPARGRKFLVINSDNTVEYNFIAPNDMFNRVNGKVDPIDDTKFQIVLINGTTINVSKGETGVLKLEKQALPK